MGNQDIFETIKKCISVICYYSHILQDVVIADALCFIFKKIGRNFAEIMKMGLAVSEMNTFRW